MKRTERAIKVLWQCHGNRDKLGGIVGGMHGNQGIRELGMDMLLLCRARRKGLG